MGYYGSDINDSIQRRMNGPGADSYWIDPRIMDNASRFDPVNAVSNHNAMMAEQQRASALGPLELKADLELRNQMELMKQQAKLQNKYYRDPMEDELLKMRYNTYLQGGY